MSQNFSLQRLILIDSYRKGGIIELKLDGHTSLTGANGVGKTSLLRLIPLFYGESPNKLVQGGKVNQSFVQHYLPNTSSFIVFEYNRRGRTCMVVLYASSQNDSVCYRFVDQPFNIERFRDDLGGIVPGASLGRHIQKRGEFCSSQITALSDYRAIIQNTVSGNQDYRSLAANFSLVGSGSRLSHIEKIVTGMFSRVTSFRDIRRIIVSCIADDKTSIRLESSKTVMKDWVREYRAYTTVMEQSGRLQDFRSAHMRHKAATQQLHIVHADFAHLQQTQEAKIEQCRLKIHGIQNEIQLIEDQTNEQLREIGNQLGVAEGRAKDLEALLQKLRKRYSTYEEEGLPDLARLVDALPQLVDDLEMKDKREKALLGKSQDLASRYAEMRNSCIEAFHATEREKNALKEPIRAEGREKEAQERQKFSEAWQAITAEFDQQEESINSEKERMVEQLGGLKQASEHPQANPQLIAAKDQACAEHDAAAKAVAVALSAYNEAKSKHEAAVNAFNVICDQISSLEEQEKKDQETRKYLLSLKDAAPGTLLHFLRENRPDWTGDIARVVPEELLLRTDLEPTLVSDEALSLYGVGLDLSVLDTPELASEEELQRKIEEIDLAIERHRQSIKTKTSDKESSSKIACQAKAVFSEKQQLHASAVSMMQSRQIAMETAGRALAADIHQAGIRAKQQMQEVQKSIEENKQALNKLRAGKNTRKQAHEAEMKKRLAEIESQTQGRISEIDRLIASAKATCDQSINALNEEMNSALKALEVDTDSLNKLRKEKAKVQEDLQKARLNETRVSDWRHWLKSEWETRQEKESELESTKTNVQRLLSRESEIRKTRETRRSEIEKELSKVNLEKANIEKLRAFVIKRRERLGRWPVVAELPATLTRNQDALEEDMDRLLLDVRNEEARAQEALIQIKQAFFKSPGTTPYQFYENRHMELRSQDAVSPFLWLRATEEWFEVEHENTRRLLLSQCRNFSSGVHEFHDRLNSFKRKVGIFSKDLQESMTTSTRFRFISNVAVRITTSFDDLDGWDKIKQMDEEYSVWAGKDSSDLPDFTFADAVDQVSDWLQGRHSMDIKLEDLLELEIDIEEAGQPKKTVRDEGQLRDASSNGLSYLILCVVFIGLINKIRAGQPVQLVWALDELRDLDIDNVMVLLDILTDNQIHLISAFPDPEPEILALLKNRYAIQEGRRLAVFQSEEVADV